MKRLTELKSWERLTKHYEEIKDIHLRDFFADDKNRFDKLSIEFNDILLDYSKNRINEETISLLVSLAGESDLGAWIEKMFQGDKINFTENRAVLHTALRNRQNTPVYVDGKNIMGDINSVLQHMREFTRRVHEGKWQGFSNKKITDVVNIGIGGSDLGPAMVCKALKPYAVKDLNIHFVSNVDGTHIVETLQGLNQETTLFIIASKTFTTQETLTNAMSAKRWFLSHNNTKEEDIEKHFIALSTNEKAVKEFGINPDNMFEFWDWVGGRYSLWSAIGMSIALYLGFDNFIQLLEGANEMDIHFRTAPYEKNMPVIMALLGVWYSNFFRVKSSAIIAYDQYLEYFTDFLQQLDMESNGKYVDRQGEEIDYTSGGVVWGKPGTNAQHSFFQLIHQGTQMIPCDFLAPVRSQNNISDHHDKLIANFLAQTEALMKGKTRKEVYIEMKDMGRNIEDIESIIQHKVFKGNKPTNSIFYKKLTPRKLGSIIALYEHKVFVQGIIWNINSFDQWGVELGKKLAKSILPELGSEEYIENHDSSTNGLINFYKKNR